MSTLILALGIGILVYVLFVIAVPKAVPTDSDDYLRDALNRLEEENRAADQVRTEVLRDQLREESPIVRAFFALPFMRPLYVLGLEAGFKYNLEKLVIIMLVSFGVGVLGAFMLKAGVLSIAAGLILAYLVPYKICKRRIHKRNRKFLDHFPDALDMIVRSVRSGFPLSVALNMLAENAEEPVRSEFRQVTDEIALGRSLTDALNRLASRINEPDIRFFVVVLTVQQETGGNLAEIISNLSSILRKRKQIRHKIRALTSEGKATGIILGALPVIVFAVLYFVQPDYLEPFYYHPLGQKFLAAVVALLVACYFVIKQMINVDI